MLISTEVHVDIWDVWEHMGLNQKQEFLAANRNIATVIPLDVLDKINSLRALGYTVEPPVEIEF